MTRRSLLVVVAVAGIVVSVGFPSSVVLLVSDLDGDGVAGYTEIQHGLDPFDADSNGDGRLDSITSTPQTATPSLTSVDRSTPTVVGGTDTTATPTATVETPDRGNRQTDRPTDRDNTEEPEGEDTDESGQETERTTPEPQDEDADSGATTAGQGTAPAAP